MSNPIETVSVNILGKPYAIKCPTANKAELNTCVDLINAHMAQLSTQRNQLNRDQLSVLTALNFAQRYLQEKKVKTPIFSNDSAQLQAIAAKIEEKLAKDSESGV